MSPLVQNEQIARLAPPELRALFRKDGYIAPTAGLAAGYVQANLVIVPAAAANDFEAFCSRNPKPCPLIERTAPGCYEPTRSAPGSDLRTDLPRYRVLRNGVLADQPTSIGHVWRNDLVAFLLGCSFTFENAMLAAGLPVRHIEENRNVPMFRTNLECKTAGPFRGPMVVSMRPLSPNQIALATTVSAQFPSAHGAPIHTGDPAAIGITDIAKPDYGDPVTFRADEIPVFWACGVTPMEAILNARLELAITHEPGHMFITDLRDEALSKQPADCSAH